MLMLVLTRRAGDEVDLIGPDGRILAVVKVLALLPNQNVRLGFEADASINIRRDNLRPNEGEGHGEGEENFNR
jgi:sRNA-binding carbon storage regulator CsrA